MTAIEAGDLLWQPQEIEKTQIYQFSVYLDDQHGFDWGGDYERLWQWSVDYPELFWSSLWDWHGIIGDKGKRLLADANKMPGAQFFPDAQINYAENMLRDADDSPAFIAYGEDGRCTRLTRREVQHRTLALAGWMQSKGIGKGDRVAAYLPNCETTLIAMLATASLGAIFSSCSPDFGLNGVADRFSQITPKLLIAVDGYSYNGKEIDRLSIVAELVQKLPSLKHVLIDGYNRTTPQIDNIPKAGLFADCLSHPPIESYCRVGFNDPLYILYSSGTTGAPKCIVHSTGGTLIQHIKEHRLHSDISEKDTLFYFTTCGWMMWNWLVSGLMMQSRVIVYEGNPFYPGPERLWQIAEAEKMTLFGTSAKYIDAVRKSGLKPASAFDLSHLRMLCSTGSPLSSEGFGFVYQAIKQDIQLASISGGTDIMGCFVLGCPTKPVYAGEIQARALGMAVAILNDEGQQIEGEQGELCCLAPFPSMPVGFWNDSDGSRYHSAYFDVYPDIWRHGDWATHTPNGGIIIHGRSDATLNPGGVRIGTAEIYRIVESFDEVAESLVIGQMVEHDVRIVLFLRMAENENLDDKLQARIKDALKRQASPRHVPAIILSVRDIPRTRSGKITELAVRDVIQGRRVKNTEALANPEALEAFKNLPELKT
ncbi:MAG: Acetyl-coenzyme A synthetase [Rhodospirillaceae bacterium]|jgi:acetoacetyl-CoA synthetase|nr:MAG: Acetyl-coenzyme A synthetase [Rhodospirillaceae bacterium]